MDRSIFRRTRRQFLGAACIAGPAILLPRGGRSQTEFAWKRRFYEREVSLPATPDETIEQVRKRAANVKPTPEKLAWMNLEFISFPHFGMSTFSGVQQGDGKQNPGDLHPRQVRRVAVGERPQGRGHQNDRLRRQAPRRVSPCGRPRRTTIRKEFALEERKGRHGEGNGRRLPQGGAEIRVLPLLVGQT